MKRRHFLCSVSAALLAVPLGTEAQQQAGTPRRVGFLEAASSSVNRHFLDAFRQGLRELGYVEGQQIVIEDRWAEGRVEGFPGLLTELIGLKVDIIVVSSNAGVLAAKNSTKTIPIIFVAVGDPLRLGLVVSLGRPGGNITGLSTLSDEYAGKWVELLKEIVPRALLVGLLWNPKNIHAARAKEVQDGARARHMKLESFEVGDPDELDSTFATMTRHRIDGLIVIGDPLTVRYRTRIVELAAKNRLSTVYGIPEFVRAGGLLAYGPNYADLFRRAATYVDKILKGAKPGDLPVELPTKFQLIINLKTAKALGLTIPPSLLLRADQVLE
jgi:putative tryptophan/tyrosine transport system substrate-binding protein